MIYCDSPLLYLIHFIRVLFVSLSRGLSILLIFSKNQFLISLILWIVFEGGILVHYFYSNFYYFFPPTCFVLLLLVVIQFLRLCGQVVYVGPSSFLINTQKTMNFSLNTAFLCPTSSVSLYPHSYLFSGNFWLHLWYSLYPSSCSVRRYLVSMHLHFSLFHVFSAPWSEKAFGMILILLTLLKDVLCHSMWSILENASCVLEKNVDLAFFWWKIETSIFLLSFSLLDVLEVKRWHWSLLLLLCWYQHLPSSILAVVLSIVLNTHFGAYMFMYMSSLWHTCPLVIKK